MKIVSLQSGSNGNCIYVEARGVRLLFDAGISGRQTQLRLAQCGVDIKRIDALLISHDHRDHVRCAGIYQRKFGLPLHVTKKTLDAARAHHALGPVSDIHHFDAGATLRFGDVTVETITTPHDGVDGVAFVVDDGVRRMGILTDLGHVFDDLVSVMPSLDATVIESNYDPQLLSRGPYPEFLKQRIQGPGGHLSNVESAQLVRDVAHGRLQWVCLAHLSEENNAPDLAKRTHRQIYGSQLPLHVASRYQASEVLEV